MHLICANKPGCTLAVAEFWLDRDRLWFVMFVDDSDRSLKIELLPSLGRTETTIVELSEVQRLLETARCDLEIMIRDSDKLCPASA